MELAENVLNIGGHVLNAKTQAAVPSVNPGLRKNLNERGSDGRMMNATDPRPKYMIGQKYIIMCK